MIVDRHIKMVNGDLNEVCQAIYGRFHIHSEALLAHTPQAPFVDTVADSIWPIGSIFPNEYRLIYALVRTLKPRHCVEAGTYWGCSATAILSALNANDSGKLVSFDIMADMGGRIPNDLKSRWQAIVGDAATQLLNYAPFIPIDFFFEDTEHTRESTRAITQAALPHMATGSLMLWHDPISRPDVLDGLADCDIIPEIYLLEGSNCGVAVWQKP